MGCLKLHTDYYKDNSSNCLSLALLNGANPKTHTVDYRFGFNGYENEPDIAGQGSVIDFGARIYDSRLGRIFSTDPINFPYWSPYQYDANSPISVKDVLGMGPIERYSGIKRLGNWLAGNSYKNKANKFAVDNRLNDKDVTYKDGKAFVTYEKFQFLGTTSGTISGTTVNRKVTLSTAIYGYVKHQKVFDDNTKFKFGVSGKVDIGPQAKIKLGSMVDAQLNVAAAELWSFKGDIIGEDAWSTDHIGKDGVKITQGLALNVKIPLKNIPILEDIQFGAGVTHSFTELSYGSKDEKTKYSAGFGVTLLQSPSASEVKSTPLTVTENIHASMNKPLSGSIKASGKKSGGKYFSGIDGSIGAALGIGVQVSFKLGYESE